MNKNLFKDSMIWSMYKESETVINNRDKLEIEKIRKDLKNRMLIKMI